LERVVWLAGQYIQLLNAGWGWLAGQFKRRRAGQAGRYKIFLMLVVGWGEGRFPWSGRDTLHLHYTPETTSLSTILSITRCTFYFVSVE
jgi:hypothetical protein